MAIFLTGATGYLGSYVADQLLRGHNDRLAVLVRAKSDAHAHERLWKAWQMHMDFATFRQFVADRVDIYLGDLTDANLGLDDDRWKHLAHTTDSILHVAASLNRKSDKACFNVNLRGTLDVIRLARAAHDHHGLRRITDVSTTAVAGHRNGGTVTEDDMIDWARSDYDPYARTKKFCEHMLHELLPDVDSVVVRPSTVLGDSRFPETTQFDMVRAFVYLASLPIVPLSAKWRMDIVPADFVTRGIVKVHQMAERPYPSYNLSAGEASESYQAIMEALAVHSGRRPLFVPGLKSPFASVVSAAASSSRKNVVTFSASLMHVFMPYLTFDTVFENKRIVEVLGETPTLFTKYAWPLFRFASEGKFSYPYQPWPTGAVIPMGEANAEAGE